MTHIAMDKWLSAQENLETLWILYHHWWNNCFAGNEDAKSVLRKYPKLLKKNARETRKAFYLEIRKKKALVWIAHKHYRDELRFNAFSDVFYNRMHVDVEFARFILYAFLGTSKPPTTHSKNS